MVEEVIAIARAAGEEVLEVYERGCGVERKQDGSPVTPADRRAQEIICARLERVAPGIPIVAEETTDTTTAAIERRGAEASGAKIERGARRAVPSRCDFWLVDPLDGTKEFVARNGEFTINIALIEAGAPVLGVVLAPALDRLYAAASGAAVIEDAGGRRPLAARIAPAEGATVVSSRSHCDPEALARFIAGRKIARSISAGSSLKFCLLAAGEADLYPRFGRTMEWDTAAGDAILRAAGGRVIDLNGDPLRYGKPGFENPSFVAVGRSGALAG
jgi:3'(2'), 5'-bisphosphate nucleotidase